MANKAGKAIHENNDFVDYYEILQLSPNADRTTVERVFRLLAEKCHPNNKETGDSKSYERLLKAYRMLSDPERRAEYDAQYRAHRKQRWKIFHGGDPEQAQQAVQETRRAILSVLYVKRIKDLDNPGMTVLEIEELTGCPREHLHVAAWYLREKRWIELTGEGSRYAITATGMDVWEDWSSAADTDFEDAEVLAGHAPEPHGSNGAQQSTGHASERSAKPEAESHTNGINAGHELMQSLQKLSAVTLTPIPITHMRPLGPSHAKRLGHLKPRAFAGSRPNRSTNEQ